MTGRRRGAALVVALALAGCGGGDERRAQAERANAAVREAAQRTLEQGSARQRLVSLSLPARKLDFEYDGLVDLLNDREQVTILYRAFEDIDPGTKVEMITVDKIDYIRPEGQRTWLRLKAAPEDAVTNFTDLGTSLTYLGDVTDGGREDGREDVRGEPTTRYEARIDMREVAKVAPPEARAGYEQMMAAFRTDHIPVTVWVGDRDKTIRRIRWTLDYPPVNGETPQGEKRLITTAELYDFGVEAAIEPPPERITKDE